jgi:hypothetical protein
MGSWYILFRLLLPVVAFVTGWMAAVRWRSQVRRAAEAKRQAKEAWHDVERLAQELERDRADRRDHPSAAD